jgi:hydrogenase expression/formation protein HypD
MEVCGTHTVSLRRHGIHSVLPEPIQLISGPGCPVCVTPTEYIDNALDLLDNEPVVIATFGDMVKVPGSDGRTLTGFIGQGRVRILYSPLQLAELCGEVGNEAKTVVFLAVGFETTIPAVVGALSDAINREEKRLLFYTAFKTVPPALCALLDDPDCAIDGFLLPGHVSVILGEIGYEFLAKYGVPGVITGFEPIEMLAGIEALVRNVRDNTFDIYNAYPRVVRRDGNSRARDLIQRFLEPTDANWRGLGTIPNSALSIRDEYSRFDAAVRYKLEEKPVADPGGCRCGDVISGRCVPTDCRHFGKGCTPDKPVGPCMVSSEGTCAAYLKYGSIRL